MNKVKDNRDRVNETGVATGTFYASSGDTVTLPLDPSTVDEKLIQDVDHTEEQLPRIPFVRIRIHREDDVQGFYLLMQAVPVSCFPDRTYLIPSSLLEKLDNADISYEIC